MTNGLDVLNEFTKEEIIAFVREKGFFLRISRRDLLYIRWKTASEKLMADYDAELARWDAEKPNFKKRDALAIQCNASKDIHERLRLLREIEPYDRALQDHISRTRKLDARQKTVDRMYRDIEREAA
ncbi:hypothetical protein [Achromobacter aegrifaciens]|uniref:hypothetical protein n=1 Tax=Achromobacter aegrifaciens TaxID=1287736 RepID=UPI0028AAA5B6|nr:hypothetical protein [Achromobacter aegrifaciens]